MNELPKFLEGRISQADAVDEYGIDPSTFHKFRTRSENPLPYTLWARKIYYDRAVLEEWLASRTRRRWRSKQAPSRRSKKRPAKKSPTKRTPSKRPGRGGGRRKQRA